MNDKYIKLQDKKYIVLENESDVSLVESENDIEEILKLENEREDIFKKIKELNNELRELKNKKECKKLFNCAILLIELGIFIIGTTIPVLHVPSIYYMIFSFLAMKFVEKEIIGTNKKISKEKEKLSIQKEILLTDHKEIDDKINKLKYTNRFNKESLYNIIDIEINKSINKDKVKKLTLEKPKKN